MMSACPRDESEMRDEGITAAIRILVVDDDFSSADALQQQLTGYGYLVYPARSLIQAREILSRHPIDAAVVDVYLNEDRGLDLLDDVANSPCPLPVVMITGRPDLGVGAEALRRHAFDILAKPFLGDELRATLERALAFKRLADEKRLAEEERDRHRRHLEVIFAALEDGFVTVDGQSRIAKANRAASVICGCMTPGGSPVPLDSLLDRGCPLFPAIDHAIASGCATHGLRVECDTSGRSCVLVANMEPIEPLPGERSVLISLKDISRLDYLERQLNERQSLSKLVGQNARMQNVYDLIETLSGVDTTVLICGESGTGKELVAEAIHTRGARAKFPLIRVNCSALSENLLEAELFGSVKGAFTGATADRKGRFELANGGTIFLDEVGDLAPSVQIKLLRVLQEREIERVGDSRPREIDVRVIAATNRDLSALVTRGRFRSDLYYRLKVVEMSLPPLRERRDDIPLLTRHFIERFNQRLGRRVTGFTDVFHDRLMRHPWKGNVRELMHTIEHACVFCDGETLDIHHLPDEMIRSRSTAVTADSPVTADALRLRAELEAHNWNQTRAAEALGVSRMTIHRWIRKFALSRTDTAAHA